MIAHKSEWPAGTGQNAKENTDTATVALAQKIGNSLAALIAQFALRGHQVIVTDRDDFLVCRWRLVRYCKDFAALEAFARQVGVRP